jgi:hypothetical protein
MLQALRPDGSASFVGHERVTATVTGRKGSFVLQDAAPSVRRGTWTGAGSSCPARAQASSAGCGIAAVVGESAAITLDCWFE